MFKTIQSFFGIFLLSVASLAPVALNPVFAEEGNMATADFMFNVNGLTPTDSKYEEGTKLNLKNILSRVGTLLLIVIPMLAVLFIVVGGIMMATASMGGKDSQFSKGKTIITFNIIALVLSLTSYSIMQLIAWALQIK